MKLIVGASKPKCWKPGAAAIMWWENTSASHVYTKIEVLPGLWVIFQAVGSGTEFCNLEYFQNHAVVVYEKEIEITELQFNKIMIGAVKLLKTKYSVKHLVGLFYKRFIQYVFHKIIKVPFASDGKSEVCVQAMVSLVDSAEIKRDAEDPKDMGMFEAMILMKSLPGRELING